MIFVYFVWWIGDDDWFCVDGIIVIYVLGYDGVVGFVWFGGWILYCVVLSVYLIFFI